MDIGISEGYTYSVLKKFLDNNTENIIMSATVNRALIDKISTEIITQKVSNQFNSMQSSIYQINPKFNEKSKYYDTIKKEITEVLDDYETTLVKYSDEFDMKLEKLLLQKVELESHLIGKIFKEEKFKSDENTKEKEKATDKLKTILEEKNKKIFEFILENKRKNELDVQDIRKLEDSFDLEKEQSHKLDKKIEKIQEENKTNMSEIAKIEIDLQKLNKEIEKMSNEKKIFLEEAMESKNKDISKIIKKPGTFFRITRFFLNKFNTYKVIENSIIQPLRSRIVEFKEVENNS